MRNFVFLFLLLAGPLAAQPAAPGAHPDVPAAFDVAGLHLVLTDEAQRLVQQKADGLCRHQPSFQARVDLADASFPLIDRVLKEEGVPLDFRYLALQESALQGDARSVHDAVGYWQLKRETATGLGLLVNEVVDERQHLTASTRAAARYLARNNATLHNWLTALLSYNTGLGGVRPYILPTDADATEVAITEATSPYVLMFLAQKLAFEPACGLNPRPPLRLQEFPAVAGQTLEAQALTLHTDPLDLAAHNHWLLAPTVPAGRPYTLIVPVGDITQAAGIAANQRLQSSQELLALPALGATTAEVRVNELRALIALPGETTADLARRGGQKLGEFLRHNELTAFDAAVPGRPYYLESKREAAAVEYHVVQAGETVLDVAQKYGIRKKAILAKNRLARVDELRPGRVLWLQHVRPRETAVEYRPLPEAAALERPVGTGNQRASTEAKDGWGEALPGPVAKVPAPVRPAPTSAPLPPPAPAPAPTPLADEPRYPEPAVAPVPARTPVAPPAAPKPATKAVVSPPLPAASPSAVAPTPVAPPEATHRVEPGETVYSISRLCQIPPATLMALNHLTSPAALAVGQVLVLPAQGAAGTPAPVAHPAGRPNPAFYIPKSAAQPAPAPVAAPVAGPPPHTVAAGETLYSIARRYGVKVADLQAWNAKADPSVKVGEVLRVQAASR
ncbi:MAG: hypothetical protein NVSMB30_09550 [Hymenobacter sp.]